MRLLPFERLTLGTAAPVETVEAKLATLMASEFRGTYGGRHFEIVRVPSLPIPNSFRPIIDGDVVQVPGGTEIRITMDLPPSVGAMMGIWFGFLLLGFLFFLIAGLVVGFAPYAGATGTYVDAGGAVPVLAGMILLGHVTVSIGFWPEVRKARRLLTEGLGCQDVTVANRLVRR